MLEDRRRRVEVHNVSKKFSRAWNLNTHKIEKQNQFGNVQFVEGTSAVLITYRGTRLRNIRLQALTLQAPPVRGYSTRVGT